MLYTFPKNAQDSDSIARILPASQGKDVLYPEFPAMDQINWKENYVAAIRSAKKVRH